MRIRIDGIERVVRFSRKTPGGYYYMVFNDNHQPVAEHSFANPLDRNMKFRTNGHQYETGDLEGNYRTTTA